MPVSNSLHPAVPSAPRKARPAWPASDVAVVRRRLAHLLRAKDDAKDDAIRTFLNYLEGCGIRRLKAYVDGINDDDLLVYVEQAEAAVIAHEAAGRAGRFLPQVRKPVACDRDKRWRTTTA